MILTPDIAIVRYPQEGVGPEAETLRGLVEDYRSAVPSRVVDWRDELQKTAIEVFNECQEPGWDGYDATPISKAALEGAIALVAVLPDRIDTPDIVPEADGRIALEWDRGTDMIFSLSVEGNNLVYAGILGAGKRRSGEALFSKEMPFAIEHALSEHFSQAGPDEADD